MRDEKFIRGNIPMTKSEVRAVSLSKMELRRDDIVYDIGAGTGSVSVEAALAVMNGHVYAFEQKEEGCRLIRQNAEKFGVKNLTVIPGKVPDTLTMETEDRLPAPDCVFIGGTGGNMDEILNLLLRENPSLRIVLNVIALETLAQITEYVKRKQLDAEFVSVQVARGERLGRYHLMQSMNPVYVITINPVAVHSDTANRDTINPDIVNPDTNNPDTANPDTANPDIANSNTANPACIVAGTGAR